MSSGKINNAEFEDIILKKNGKDRSEIHCGPAFGVDVSVVNLPNGLALAMTSDPLTLIPSLGLQESAWLSVHLMANDMATTGFAPMYAQMVLNLPTSLSEQDFNTYWTFVHQNCRSIGVAITGGHTGRIEGQNSTISGGGTMMLYAPGESILLSRYAQEDDLILVTKACALSSSAVLAMSFPETVKNAIGKEHYDLACSLFYQTSSLAEALIAKEFGHNAVRAMHDVTEGGVLGAVYEMAIASGNGVEIENSAIPVSETVQEISDLFGLDPRFIVGAGSMVMAADKFQANALIKKLADQHIQATIIGKFTSKERGYKLISNDEVTDLPYFSTDPYWNAFFTSKQKGWK
ncbi:AIR synthase [Pedobacter sp. Leaf41]|uniref:AIR synthase family protein n=1 Tax=Pedobacter sp. Leaf41 TaxID=1736218 RepID=UPI000703139C|nr:AIR synthase family protein [Pedobacter sp. Leaf41]KQN34963.1 AIR synthase [Pedobacter sp. Leaf41]